MTPGHQAAKASLEASANEARRHPGPLPEPRVRLHADDLELVRSEMKAAVRDGLQEVLTKEKLTEFWRIGMDVLHEKATISTGRFVLNGLKAMVLRGWWVIVLIVAMWSLGGWQFVINVAKAYLSTRGPQ